MKYRNPFFVALIPVVPIIFFYSLSFIMLAIRSRSPIVNVIFILLGLLSFIFLFYLLIWLVRTAEEMQKLGAQIPTSLLIIVPFVNLYWYWKWAKGVEQVTNNKTSAAIAVVLIYFVGSIGMGIIQDSFNKVGAVPLAQNVPAVGGPVPIGAPAPTPVPAPTPAQEVPQTLSQPPSPIL